MHSCLHSFLLVLHVIPVFLVPHSHAYNRHAHQLKHHETDSAPKIQLFAVAWSLGRKQSNIDDLKHKNSEDRQGHDSMIDDAHSLELRRVYKTQVVLIDAVFENEEDSSYHRQVRDDRREEQHNCKRCK